MCVGIQFSHGCGLIVSPPGPVAVLTQLHSQGPTPLALPGGGAGERPSGVHPHAPAVARGSVALDGTVAAVCRTLRNKALLLPQRQQGRSLPLTRLWLCTHTTAMVSHQHASIHSVLHIHLQMTHT